MSTFELLGHFKSALLAAEPSQLHRPWEIESLTMATEIVGSKRLQLMYAPFDHVNPEAKIVIVGLTPGARQAGDALTVARRELIQGAATAEALAKAKVFASFAGPMRANLVRMLDAIGIAQMLEVETCLSLWEEDSNLAHFTSAVRYPLFVNGQNWSGTPDILRTAPIARWVIEFLGAELSALPHALFVPLGPAATKALLYLADIGIVERHRVLAGLPHPSGANAERIACFLGTKPAYLASSKTNAVALAEAKESLIKQVASLGCNPNGLSTPTRA